MKISYNPITAEALTTAPDNNDITFDLSGLNIFVKGVRFRGTDTIYKVFKKYNSSNEEGYDGLVPAPSYSPINARFLREDGTWEIPLSSGQSYILLDSTDLDTLKTEGKWYYSPSNSSNTNCPDGFNDGAELYVGKNSDNHNYQKVILYDGTVWFRIFDGENWNVWTRQYSTDENVSQILDTTENFRPVVLGYTNSSDVSQFANVNQKVYTTTSIYAQPSTGSLWANMLYSQGKPVLVEHQSLEDYVTLTTAQTITGSKTFTSPINSTVVSESYLGGNQGKAIINSLSDAGSYTMLFKGNSTNGYFTQGIYEGTYLLQHTAKSIVDEETNDVTYSVHLLDESGNSLFPGNIRASGTISGNILESRVETGTAPLNITSTTLVTNLNADLLDGKDYTQFLYNHGQNYGSSDDVRNISPWTYFSGNAMKNAPTSSDWFSGIVMAANSNSNYKSILGFDVQGNLYTSRSNNGVWYEWKTVAYTTSNVASASQVKVTQHTTNNTNYPLVWSNQNNIDTGNSDLFKSWDHLYYTPSTRILTSYGGLTTNGTIKANNAFINTGDATLKIYTGRTTDGQNDGNICFQTSIDGTDGQSHAYPTQYQARCNIVLQPRGGQVYIGTNPSTGNTTYQLYVNSKIYSNGGFVKNGSSDSYVLLGGGGHKAVSDFASSNHTHSNYMTCDGTNSITLTGGNGNNAGWRLVIEKVCQGWSINNIVFSIASRHTCQGVLSIGFHITNSDATTYTYSINFKGSTASNSAGPWRAFYNTSTKKFRLYWYYSDYNDTRINVLARVGFDAPNKNGTWYTSFPSDNGTELTIYYNNADTLDGLHSSNFMRAVNANGFYGMARPDGNTSDWIRTTSNGIIPYQSGGSTAGHCSIGTSSWYFSAAYIQTVYGTLQGNASSASKLGTSTVGNSTTPIYLNGGSPVACSDIIGTRIKWAYYQVTVSSSVTYSKWAGNHNFISSASRLDVGKAQIWISYPSGANYKNTIVLATGHHAETSWDSTAYPSIQPDYSSGGSLKLLIADDSTRNNGVAMILFMYIS